MGVRAPAVDAEAVERRRIRGCEIAVGAAAGGGVHQFEADLGGERFGLFVEGCAGIALLVRRPVQLADDLDGDALRSRFQIEDLWNEIVGIRHRGNAHIDLGIGLFRNDVGFGAAPDKADVNGHAALDIVHAFQRLNDVGEFADRAAAVFGPRAGMGRDAFDKNLEARDALAPGDDFSAVARRLSDQHILCFAALSFDQRARRRAADLFVRNIKLGHTERRTLGARAKLPERMISQVGAALHVVDAGTEGAVALDPERQTVDESQRMNRIEMAEDKDSRLVLAPR